jgi:hypothetical protein
VSHALPFAILTLTLSPGDALTVMLTGVSVISDPVS